MAATPHDRLSAADLPRRFGRYELQTILGTGGMGQVFGAQLVGPAGFRKQVALKVIRADIIGNTDSGEAAAFIREARLGGLLRHPNIVDVYEFGEAEGRLFMAMELVRGPTLSMLIRSGRQPAAVVLEIAVGVAAGLASAHSLRTAGLEAGLVHRDLKPSNVLVSWDGEVKVADFGIATTRQGVLAEPGLAFSRGRGTLSYMSPEQMRHEPVDGRSDLFSLGLVLTELATATFLPRKALHKQLSAGGSRRGQLLGDHHLAEVDAAVPGLRPILQRCLHFSPEERHPSANALLEELEELRERVGLRHRLRSWLASEFERPAPGCAERNVAAPRGLAVDEARQGPGSEGPTAGLGASTVILQPEVRARTNLGPCLDSYVGRARELDALGQQFDSGRRLVTVKGTGGAGKTRFARRYARSQVEALSGGAWFVDLTEARTPMGMVHATAMALEVLLGAADLDGLVTKLGHAIAGRGPVLVVFDNFEQVVEHAAGTLGRWLSMAPEARFLVTSRAPLRLSGERSFPLGPLPEVDGVALFELRARAAGAGWQQTPQTRAAILGIVNGLDRLPLAIELAAARTRILSPSQVLERLSRRFHLLRGGRRGDSARQASLRGTIDWSWELLEPWEQRALAQLSVFRDGFFMEAAEAVLELSSWPAAPWSLDVVGSLLDKSLLYSRDVDGQPRFGMYVSIQEYASAELGAEHGATAARLAGHFAELGSERILDDWAGGRAGSPPHKHLVLELENLRVGVAAGLEAGALESAAACALAAARVYSRYGPFSDGVTLLHRALEHAPGGRTTWRLVRRVGTIMRLSGRNGEAEEYGRRALELAREGGRRGDEAHGWLALGQLRQDQGRTSDGLRYYQQALELFRETGNRPGESTTLANMALLLRQQGLTSEATACCKESLVIAREDGHRHAESVALGNLGLFHLDQGLLAEALWCLNEALTLAREVVDRRHEAIILGNLAVAYQEQGRTAEALDFFEQSLALTSVSGDRPSEGVNRGNLGDLMLSLGKLPEAEAHLIEAVAICDDTWPVAAGCFRGSLALICARRGAFAEARSLLDQGEPQVRRGSKLELGKLLCKWALIEEMAGDPGAATAALAEAESIVAELGSHQDMALGELLAEARARVRG